MAEILSNLVKPAMEELGRIIVVAVKRQFNYFCCFNSNIQSLNDEAEKLDELRAGLQGQVEAAENNAQVILPQVKTWLTNASNKIQVDKRRIDDEIPAVKNGCWGIKSRYLLSRKAVKITGEMKQLVEERSKFNDISTPPTPVAQVPIPLGPTYEFQSRKQMEKEIMEALGAKEVRTMGICGMGGVGKTTMAKRIMGRARKENVFDEIFMVVVSQQVNMSKIQGAIAESLGLSLGEENLLARATKLHARLMSSKRILIVLDDVWEKLKLEDLGIPCGNELHEGCTILVTSRNRDVLNKMDVQKICAMRTLSETEAWFLFKEKAGTCVDDPNLLSTAEKVVRECKGLPIALVTVGSALKEQTSIRIWKDALQQLESSNPEEMTDVIKDVYAALKLSYTYLENRHAKSFFLLCSIFPEDINISLEELTWYCMGLRMFGGITKLEQVRNRVFTIVDMLKSRFLLLNAEAEQLNPKYEPLNDDSKLYVRMHDVVRDVAIYIASKETREVLVHVESNSMDSSREYTYNWVSVFSEKLSSLLMMHSSNRDKYGLSIQVGGLRVGDRDKYEIKDLSIFERMKELLVLSFQDISLKSLPLGIQLLKNLRTLRLQSCTVESLSIVGELLSLEILNCHACDGIEELPVEIGKLNQLKLLNFSCCFNLRRIPPGVISNLVELEEFKMVCSFNGWELTATEVQGQERRNACLNEFENLSKLTCLEIAIDDFNLAEEEIQFSPDIVKYVIGIGHQYYYRTIYEEIMCMHLPREINLGSWVLRFLNTANSLYLKGDGSNYSLDLPQAHNMKSLTFEDCSTVKELVNSTTISIDDRSKFDVFPILEELSLCRLPNLEVVYDGPVLDQSNSFKNLQSFWLEDLPALKYLCKRPNRIVSLDNLHSIRIRRCNNLLNLFSFTMANDVSLQLDRQNHNVDDLLCTQQVFFPMLEMLDLEELDKLEVIWNDQIPEGSNSLKNLRKLRLSNLPAITHLWKSPNISLDNLRDITICKCNNLLNLFSFTMANDISLQLDRQNPNVDDLLCTQQVFFPMLETLYLEALDKLEVIWNAQILEGSNSFKNLRQLRLSNLPAMTHLWKSTNISLSNLFEIHIIECHKLHSLFSSTMSMDFLSQLTRLEILNCKMMDQVLLNEENENDRNQCRTIHFSKLSELTLNSLESLTGFSKGIESIEFPMLVNLDIRDCPELQSLLSSSETNQNSTYDHDDDTSHLFCSQKVIFGSLKKVSIGIDDKSNIWCQQISLGFFSELEELEIKSCKGIKSLFSSSIAVNLVKIKKLRIWYCNEMLKVIEDDEKMLSEKPHRLLPNLKELELLNLPKLQSFCNWRCDLQLPSIEKVYIGDTLGRGLFFGLRSKTVEIHSKLKDVGELNGAIQLHFEANQHRVISTAEGKYDQELISTEALEVKTDHERSDIEGEEIE